MGQDFVLLNTPVMPLGTVALFRDAVYYAIESSPLLLAGNCCCAGAGVLLGLSRCAARRPRRWTSATGVPRRIGSARAGGEVFAAAHLEASQPQAARPGESYLSEAMQAHLSSHVASFDFCVQLRKEGMPIEDAGQRWDERGSPFVKVATLHIPRQTFRAPEREALAESLSFSPGHALPEHAPLGGLNRAREKIYAALSKFRHQRDKRDDIA